MIFKFKVQYIINSILKNTQAIHLKSMDRYVTTGVGISDGEKIFLVYQPKSIFPLKINLC